MKPPENQNEILESFRQGPSILENALSGLTESELDYLPSNGGWTIRQIVHHISDGDDLWKIAIKMALGNEQAQFTLNWYQAFPQIEWSKFWSYENRPIDVSLSLLRANRDHILQLLDHVTGGWIKSVQFLNSNGEIEAVPVGFVIQMQTDHVVHHVRRIKIIREEISKT